MSYFAGKVNRKGFMCFCACLCCVVSHSRTTSVIFRPGEIWLDDQGVHINAHGGGILYHDNTYYWFGEHKAEDSNSAWVGVMCYSSHDLANWKNEGVALSVVKNDTTSVIYEGCIIERPKVIFNSKTGKFVMYFHHELKGQGYRAAQTGIAISDRATGPYHFVKSYRPCAGYWPENMSESQKTSIVKPSDFKDRNTPEWKAAIVDGVYVRRDFDTGQMSRDMTLYVDDDGKAYHIYASEENQTIHIAELTDDYLGHTGKYYRVAPAGWNEAPAIFKKDGRYFMITSGCTGWKPNAARLHTADKINGPWTEHPNPCVGKDSDLTFNGQSTYILPVYGKKDAFIFMADRWVPQHPIDGRYIWLPIVFKNGLPVLYWTNEWSMDVFDN
jgi:beta-xylosidase